MTRFLSSAQRRELQKDLGLPSVGVDPRGVDHNLREP